jgi:peroxiredoxin
MSEIKELDADVIAIASRGNHKDVEKTKTQLGITFTLVPVPNRKAAEDFGVYNPERKRAIATLILDKEGLIRFKYISKNENDRPKFSKLVNVLQEIK